VRRRQPEAPRCLHTRREPVQTLGGELVAQLCLTCDAELTADYRPSLTDLFFNPALIEQSGR